MQWTLATMAVLKDTNSVNIFPKIAANSDLGLGFSKVGISRWGGFWSDET